MKKQILLQNKKVIYTLRESKRAKRLRLSVSCGGSVVVTMPRNFKESAAEKFIQEKTEWLLSKINFFAKFKSIPFVLRGKKDYLKNKNDALKLAKKKVVCFNKLYGFKVNGITVKNQKTRWGSCSRTGNLNFNYKIIFLPENLRDYVVVHELCHLGELNHSRNFWNLVAKTFPQWRSLRSDLKRTVLQI